MGCQGKQNKQVIYNSLTKIGNGKALENNNSRKTLLTLALKKVGREWSYKSLVK